MRMIPVARLALALVAASLAAPVCAQTAPTPITLDQAMADPDWIGPPVETAWWAWDSQRVHYTLKRRGATIRDTYVQAIDAGAAAVVEGASRASIDAAEPVFDPQRARMAFIRNGDVFVRDLRSGVLTQVTRSDAAESRPQWGNDGGLVFRVGNDWSRWHAASGVGQATSVKTAKDPNASPKPDDLRERQLRLIETLKSDKERREASRAQDTARRASDPTRSPDMVYLGDGIEIVDSALSPDGTWLVVVTQSKDGGGQAGKMPKYVTESGYEEFEEARTRVGLADPRPHTAWLVDVRAAKATELKFDALPGIDVDPLSALRKSAGKDALKGARAVRVETDGDGTNPAMHWSPDGRHLALIVRAVDNKDRWITSVDVPRQALSTRHRLTDLAWINWNFNAFGWTGDNALWFLSEESGYAHLYVDGDGAPRQLTRGKWEVSAPQLSLDGQRFLFVCNRAWPGDTEVCSVDRNGGDVREITALDGVETFEQSPDGTRLLVRHSDSYVPPQVAVVNIADGATRALTDTRTAEFKSRTWIEPEYVQVPSTDGAGTIWGKYYGPRTPEPGRRYPIVMFVHGAGYLQNVHDRYPNYFREQMFHNLLVQQGYIVLDLDFRASSGYGRDWRTAIYRRMGTPELRDYLDGLAWLGREKQGDTNRAGIYGGSYGGFMAFMALFKSPGTFKAGAALRPVTDWSQYNHEYTSNILNTPAIDPEAYRISSPIEHAAGLKDHLLIAHGMIDDNVFYKDSVMMAQKLIELRKDKWELASYPLERHGFTHPDAWYDEYRRIDELFNRVLKPQQEQEPSR